MACSAAGKQSCESSDIRNFIAYGVFAMPAESSRKIVPNAPYRRET
jgi:hypothetical protein